jgi:Concanavalin A-like lectin/glucanases superfamily/PEP-CTERM motif
MKKIFFCVVTIIYPCIGVFAQSLPNPTAWWKLEGNADDFAGSANGVAVNIQWTSSNLLGNTKTVALFDLNSTINVAEQSNIQLGSAFSLTAWLNAAIWPPEGPNNQYTIFGAGGQPLVSETSYSLVVGSYKTSFSMSGASDYPINSQVYNYGGEFDAVSANTWTHYALTYDGTKVRAYVNGIVVSNVASYSNANNISPYSNFGNLRFGTSHGGDPNFVGMLSDLRIYDTALNDEQVATAASIPEPSTYALLLLSGAASLVALRRRKTPTP